MNTYLELFFTFAKVGACTFGGGYAMLPILQREVVEQKGWFTDEMLTTMIAVSESTPGPIGANMVYHGGRGGCGGSLCMHQVDAAEKTPPHRGDWRFCGYRRGISALTPKGKMPHSGAPFVRSSHRQSEK